MCSSLRIAALPRAIKALLQRLNDPVMLHGYQRRHEQPAAQERPADAPDAGPPLEHHDSCSLGFRPAKATTALASSNASRSPSPAAAGPPSCRRYPGCSPAAPCAGAGPGRCRCEGLANPLDVVLDAAQQATPPAHGQARRRFPVGPADRPGAAPVRAGASTPMARAARDAAWPGGSGRRASSLASTQSVLRALGPGIPFDLGG